MLDGHLAGKPFLHVLAIIAAACRCAKASNAEAVGGGLGNSIDESIASGADVDDEPVATIFSPKSFGATDLLNLDSDELAADGDETWRSQPRANTGTIDPFSCVDTSRRSVIACFDFSTASCTAFLERPCDCGSSRPICVTQSGKKASPASTDRPELYSCCSRPGTASEGMLLGKARESSPFAKKIMEKALSSWDTREKTKCISTARSARGTISLTDCKTKCLEEKREIEPKECDAILYKEKGNGKGLCFVLFGLDEPSCAESDTWKTLVYKKK
mmetsp:Transcript_1452/g.3408  ORF Transcript_1452/g.3408 Transcript_1452/m.3408 type:complete len:274 (+) Transcript_1452:64-885(+)|eukprot:s348_g25.t1